jgi:hypothetical protein
MWAATTKEIYWDMLEVLPPAAMMGGGFLVGEPVDHHATSGQPRFEAFIKQGEKYSVSSRPITRKEFTALFASVSAHAAAESAAI